MIRLLFVGDGERDAAMNPCRVGTITGAEIEATALRWPHSAGRGFDRKLLFAIRQAREAGLQGVVATIDKDKSPGRDRLRDLEAGRTKDRELAAPLPAALGCADPHAEAWLLDDPVAVHETLRLAADAVIPNVRRVDSPKDSLTGLHRQSPRAVEPIRTILVEIARAVQNRRCQHAKETGYARFKKEVEDEIGPWPDSPATRLGGAVRARICPTMSARRARGAARGHRGKTG